jgi:pyruvate,orthophosphate dikinase
MDAMKKEKGYTSDTDLTAEDLKKLCALFKAKVKEVLGKDFPDEPRGAALGRHRCGCFSSWNGKRAVSYRRIEGIPDEWGTAL